MEEPFGDEAARHAIVQAEEDTNVAMRFLLEEVLTSSDEEESQFGGSNRGRAPNKDRDFLAAYQRVVVNYFNGLQSVCDDKDFE